MKILRFGILYGVAIAMAAFVLGWLEYRYATRLFTTEIYIAVIAAIFALLGIWIGIRLTSKPAAESFERNTKALVALGITDREYEALCLLEKGQTNKEIGNTLCISLNTVKTHLAHLYEKLQVTTRTQAIRKAKELRLVQ